METAFDPKRVIREAQGPQLGLDYRYDCLPKRIRDTKIPTTDGNARDDGRAGYPSE
jgi:hypothetical protein